MGLFPSAKIMVSNDFIIPDNVSDINLLNSYGDTRNKWVFHSGEETNSDYGPVTFSLENNEILADASTSSKADNQALMCFPYKIDFSKFSKFQVVYSIISGGTSTSYITGQIYEDFAQFDNIYNQANARQAIEPRERIFFKNAYDNTNSSNVVKDITYKGVGVLVVTSYCNAGRIFKFTSIRLFN